MRVLITGLGAVSCLGEGMREHRQAFATGRSGITEVREPDDVLPVGASVGALEGALEGARVGARLGRVMLANDSVQSIGSPRVWEFLQRALTEALNAAGLRKSANDADSADIAPLPACPMYIGSAHGDLDSWLQEHRGTGSVRPLWEPASLISGTRMQSMPTTLVSTACTASAVALGLAFDALRGGDAEIAIVAGAESITPFLYAGFDSLRSLARGACRPFDRERDGLVLGEGAAVLVIETEAHASRRGATGIAEIAGYGFASDAAYLTAPDPAGAGASSALRQAIAQAGFSGVPDFINAHGTGTKLNDRMECIAIKRTFGQQARDIPITSTKPLTGHLCGAAGAMEILSTAVALQSSIVPGLPGFEQSDPEFAELDFIREPARSGHFTTAISMNSGFGGTNTAIALRRLAQ